MRKDIRGCRLLWSCCHHIGRLANSVRVVGRRAMFLSSCVFFASVGGGPFGAVSQGSVALDGTLFDSAYDISHLVVFFTWAISHPRCARLSERRDSLLTLSAWRTPFLRASDLYPTGPQGAKGCRDFDWRCSFTANHELGFRLTAVIARRQEQLSSLLVDPTCRRGDMAAITVDNSRTFAHEASALGLPLILHFRSYRT